MRQICTHIYIQQWCLSADPPLTSVFALSCSPCMNQPLPFTYLEILLLLLVVRIPIYSFPCLAINCSPLAVSPIPRHPTDQVMCLHRWHQQHQLSCLIQYGSEPWIWILTRIWVFQQLLMNHFVIQHIADKKKVLKCFFKQSSDKK